MEKGVFFNKKNVGRSPLSLLSEQYPLQRWTDGVKAATRDASSGESGEN